MRFCQADGTPLVEDPPVVDPYKTMVASSEEISSAIPSAAGSAQEENANLKTDSEVLQLPAEPDPRKTMYVSEEEIRKEMAAHDEPVMELPPLAPEPPKFSEPTVEPPTFTAAPPPSPFDRSDNEPISNPSEDRSFNRTTPPIPSPFDKPKPAAFEPPPLAGSEPLAASAPIGDPVISDPSESPAAFEPAPAEPLQNWEPNEPMQNTPMSAGPQGQNKTLAIISLVTGVLGVTVCCGTVVFNLAAILLGFIARSKAGSDPANYGGAGLALGGIITGVIGLIISLAYLVFLFFFGGMELLMRGM